MGNKFCKKKRLNINSVDKKKVFEKANELLNARKYADSKTLETALESIRKKDSEADIWVGTTRADDFLATLKNQETIGLSSVPDDSKPLGLMLDQETLELIKKLGPKK
jgi:hypothetical protein